MYDIWWYMIYDIYDIWWYMMYMMYDLAPIEMYDLAPRNWSAIWRHLCKQNWIIIFWTEPLWSWIILAGWRVRIHFLKWGWIRVSKYVWIHLKLNFAVFIGQSGCFFRVGSGSGFFTKIECGSRSGFLYRRSDPGKTHLCPKLLNEIRLTVNSG